MILHSRIMLIFLFSYLLNSWHLTEGEKVYHNRDRSDIQQGPANRAETVVTHKFAQRYLWKYGWTEPVKWESLQYESVMEPEEEDVAPPDVSVVLMEDHSESGNVEKSQDAEPTESPQFLNALRRFQEANGLPVTGILDKATKKIMNTPRCGVPDHKVPETKEGTSMPNANRITKDANSRSTGNTADISNFSENTTTSAIEQSNITDHTGATNSTNANGSGQIVQGRLLQRLVEHARKKRSDSLRNGIKTVAFPKPKVKWRLLGEGYSEWLPTDQQRYILNLAFRMWSEVVPLIFEEDIISPAYEIDIKLGFGTRRHLGCSQVFDGMGQEFAHAWHLGDIHFDDDEHFVPPNSKEGISLLKVALHEIGHVLGLTHMNQMGSIMQPNYIPANTKEELDWMDRKAIQKIYGKCEGRFNTVFDWVRKESKENGIYHYNTYFFRSSWYWMYENRNNRTRYGDPIQLSTGWLGIPQTDIDAFVHIWTWNKDYTLFFKGTQYWRYDNENDKAYTMDPEGNKYPRLITEGFIGVFSTIDTAFFDKRDNNIYFFREHNVTAFNVETNNIVEGYPKPIKYVFPAVFPDDHPMGNLDAVYFSYAHDDIFFIKDKYVWKVVNEKDRHSNSTLPKNGLLFRHQLNELWHDICDVHPSVLSTSKRKNMSTPSGNSSN
ncbi:matrix metalloproteinase-21 [Microcaecilia unicolor]|uniref:Matrix metalloproteinase-21-like n=1 Tax=Microcaecilia unicolor TaxID=1415580 RepID=A0A6P7X839_9AMPH|nr:matrix metalloproteinase-21-like [Microcaecilia unicolor]